MESSSFSDMPSCVHELDPGLQKSSSEKVFHQLQVFGDLRFTGRINIQTVGSPVSSLYLCLGRMVWFSGGYHPLHRWRRLLTQFLPNIEELGVSELVRASRGRQGYEILSQLLGQGRIRRNQMVSLEIRWCR